MKKNNSILYIIFLIFVMAFSLYMLSLPDKEVEEVYHKEYNPALELADLNVYFNNYISEYNAIIINSYIENNTLDNINLLTDKNKIIFIFKNILKDKNNYDKFLVLDKKTLENVDEEPNSKNVYSYLYITDFKTKYEKIFNEEFKIKEKDISPSNNEFDKINLYLYYKNNNTKYSITSIAANNNTIDDNYVITSKVIISLNNELQKKIGKNNISAIIKYTYLDKDTIKVISFQTE